MLDHLQLLVADDAPAMRFAIAETLRRAGAATAEAANGAEALHLALEKPFDLLLLDVEMPLMNGPEVARRLRTSGFSRPILALCGNGGEEVRADCLSAGMNAVLQKPCARQLLLEEVLRVCNEGAYQPGAIAPHGFSFPSFFAFCGGDEAFMKRLLAIASEALPASAQRLRAAAEKGDLKRMGELAHRVRPSVEGLGMSALAGQLRQIESFANAGQYEEEISALALAAAVGLERAAQQIRQAS